jgi:hypothetical protein
VAALTASHALHLVGDTAWGVLLAVAPLALLFLVFQVLFLELPRNEVVRILTGTVAAAVGLLLFLTGVSLAFLPFGSLIGRSIADLSSPWLALVVGSVLGFVTTWGEPAVRILANEAEEASGGSINRVLVVTSICAGVAVSVGFGLLRIPLDIPISYILVPGYVLALALMRLSDPAFVAIAADAGGVATGPLANSFLLALALGASSAIEGQDPLLHGLGLVALIALAPILSIMSLGLLIRWKAGPGRTAR